jgi:hypothetical protein
MERIQRFERMIQRESHGFREKRLAYINYGERPPVMLKVFPNRFVLLVQ